MPTQRLIPYKRQEIAWSSDCQKFFDVAPAAHDILADLFLAYKAARGISQLPRVTVRRIVGSLSLGNGVGETVSMSTNIVYWGLLWVRDNILSKPPGDSAIPDPANPGPREGEWVQRGCLRGSSIASAEVDYATLGQIGSRVEIDIRQMRKQPTVDHEFVLITTADDNSAGTSDPKLSWDINIMLGLS